MPPVLHENELKDTFSNSQSHTNSISLTRDGTLSYRKMSILGSNAPIVRNSLVLLGVTLAEDKSLKNLELSDSNNVMLNDRTQLMLGTICVEDLTAKVEELRRVLCTEIPSLPSNFCFLTKEGWPLQKAQESCLKASYVVNEKNMVYIKKQFEKQKIGIVVTGGEPLGFIFTDVNSDARQIREAAEQQLKITQLLKSDYRFIEKNGWPVMTSQETMLSLLDITRDSVIYIQACAKQLETPPPQVRPSSLEHNYNIPTGSDSHISSGQDTVDQAPKKKSSSIKILGSRKESQKRLKPAKEIDVPSYCRHDSILISYVRNEAAQYALDLKQALVASGFSVYLDVHEIKTGTDWQDALNFAVTHCFLFVPLITPMYGQTQWTNREIKLADVLKKVIVPINFMDQWPPACLAIQFASTQYIPWKLESEHIKSENEKSVNARCWPPSQVKRVSQLIADCYKDNRSVKHVQITKPTDFAKTPLLSVPDAPVSDSDDTLERKQKIVISAHPKQRHLAQRLKSLFENDGHHVWCSINWYDVSDSLSSEDKSNSVPNTPRDLPPIAEEVFFNSTDSDMTQSGMEIRRLTSTRSKESEAYGRRPLSRLMSQFSDISQPAALSQEKLDRLRIFQQKVDKAGVVLVLVSEDYTKSTFSNQQIFYCEHRKRVVMIKCDNAPIPKWFKLLMGNDMIIKDNSQFECVLRARIKRALNPSSSETPKDATAEAKIKYLVDFLKCNMPLRDTRVYVTGSSKLQTVRAEEICRAIGQELAKVPNVSLVTGGYFGAPDITAKAFYEAHDSSTQSYIDESAVVHILPIHETQDLSSKAMQNPDGSFEVMPYGKTFFIGDNLKERETVVARLVDICIVIEGGPGVVHEVEEFIWNDHFVIPIRSTGGAAGGKFGIPMKIFELPPGVSSEEWALLSNPEARPEDVAKAVVSIIFSLRKAVSPTTTLRAPRFGMVHKNRKKSKKHKNPVPIGNVGKQNAVTMDSVSDLPSQFTQIQKYTENSDYSTLPSPVNNNKLTFKRQSWWKRMLRVFKR